MRHDFRHIVSAATQQCVSIDPARYSKNSLLLHSIQVGILNFVFLLSPCGQSASAEFSGRVVSILDGDTIEVLHNNRAERIRLNGIDCPEKGQAYGTKAKRAASDLVFGKEVTLKTYGLDKYGLTIADVSLPDGVIVNVELVRNGWCWWYQKYAPDNVVLAELQRRARRAGLGLWADPHPVPPWCYRKKQSREECEVGTSE